MKSIISVFITLLLSVPLYAQKLSKAEKKVIAVVDQQTNEAISFLEKIVNINSGTNNLEGVREVGMAFKQELDAMGFESKWIDMPVEMKRAGHLESERKGVKGKKLLLLGHIDTVLYYFDKVIL